MDAIADNLINSLVNLDLVGNALITRPCINWLLRQRGHLAFLDISHCPSINLNKALALRVGHPHCSVVFPTSSPSPYPPRLFELPSPERITSPLALISPFAYQMDDDEEEE